MVSDGDSEQVLLRLMGGGLPSCVMSGPSVILALLSSSSSLMYL